MRPEPQRQPHRGSAGPRPGLLGLRAGAEHSARTHGPRPCLGSTGRFLPDAQCSTSQTAHRTRASGRAGSGVRPPRWAPKVGGGKQGSEDSRRGSFLSPLLWTRPRVTPEQHTSPEQWAGTQAGADTPVADLPLSTASRTPLLCAPGPAPPRGRGLPTPPTLARMPFPGRGWRVEAEEPLGPPSSLLLLVAPAQRAAWHHRPTGMRTWRHSFGNSLTCTWWLEKY